jgi:DNA polymerase-3 subunit gamma/tau
LQDLVDALPATMIKLRSDIERYVRPVRFRHGSLTIELVSSAPSSLVGKMVSAIQDLTGELWIISTEQSGGGPTLAELRRKAKKEQAEKDRAHPAFSHSLLKNAKLLGITEIENHNVIKGDFGHEPTSAETDDEED